MDNLESIYWNRQDKSDRWAWLGVGGFSRVLSLRILNIVGMRRFWRDLRIKKKYFNGSKKNYIKVESSRN